MLIGANSCTALQREKLQVHQCPYHQHAPLAGARAGSRGFCETFALWSCCPRGTMSREHLPQWAPTWLSGSVIDLTLTWFNSCLLFTKPKYPWIQTRCVGICHCSLCFSCGLWRTNKNVCPCPVPVRMQKSWWRHSLQNPHVANAPPHKQNIYKVKLTVEKISIKQRLKENSVGPGSEPKEYLEVCIHASCIGKRSCLWPVLSSSLPISSSNPYLLSCYIFNELF